MNSFYTANGNYIIINGKRYNGNCITMVNGVVTVDGELVQGESQGIFNITIVGNVDGDVQCNGSVTVQGNVGRGVSSGGSATCKNVGGSVNAGGSVKSGKISGNVNAGGSIKCYN